MDKQIKKLNDDSVAQAAIDHPCFHEFIYYLSRNHNPYVCEHCDFEMTHSEYLRFKELEKEKENG